MRSDNYIPALRFDWLTPIYDPVVQITTREKLFKDSLVKQSKIKDNYKVLDLACGTGTLTVLLKRTAHKAEITGIDGDPRVLEIAGNKAEKAGVRINFDEALSFQMPYQEEFFDCVISSLFFHHLTRENKMKTLQEVWRVLKPAGEFHIADWGLPENQLMKFCSLFVKIFDGFETTADNFNGDLPTLINQAGFVEVKETNAYNTLLGTIRLYKSTKPKETIHLIA